MSTPEQGMPGDPVTDRFEVAAVASALAGHDDMVGYAPTPLFDAVAEQLDGDPRGARVQTWEEIKYAGGKRRLDAGADGGTGRGGEPDTRAGERGTAAVPGDGGVTSGHGDTRELV